MISRLFALLAVSFLVSSICRDSCCGRAAAFVVWGPRESLGRISALFLSYSPYRRKNPCDRVEDWKCIAVASQQLK
jgi:hypothetical protein